MKHKKWLFPILSAVVASVAVVAIWLNIESEEPSGETVVQSAHFIEPEKPSGETVVQSAHFSFIASSIEELTAEADAIVIGTVSEVAATGIDKGGDDTGLPMAYTLYNFDVAETLKGEVDDSIYVFRYDPGEFPDMPLTTLAVDDTLALYLAKGTTEYAPTITITDTMYSSVALDNGVFDVDVSGAVGRVNDDVVIRPRGIREDMFAEGATFTAAEIRKAIEPASDEVGPVGSTN